MTYEVSESARDNFGKFIYQFQPETKTLFRKLERILNKLYRKICLYYLMKDIYIYIYIIIIIVVVVVVVYIHFVIYLIVTCKYITLWSRKEVAISDIWSYRFIGLMGRVFANGPGDMGSIPGRVIPKTLKMVLDTSLSNTQQYKVRIKGKVEQSRERSSALHYTSVK